MKKPFHIFSLPRPAVIVIFILFRLIPVCSQVSDSLKNPVYILTYDHGGLVLWGTDHFAKYLRNAILWLDRYPGYRTGLDNEAYTYDFLSRNDTSLLNELRGYLKKYKGRFGIATCTYGQPLSQFINEESNIRQIGYALETDQTILQCRPYIYLMSEHAMHSQMPQILNGFGFKGAIMRTHFMMYGYNPTYDSPVGWWIGRDGSKIEAVPTYRGEGSGFGWVTEDNLILTRYPGPECNEPLESFRKKFAGINPLLASRADDSGLRQEKLVKQYDSTRDFRFLLLDDLLSKYPIPTDEFKTSPDDFHVRMPWGYCGNEIWNMSRQAEIKILTAERAAALESMAGGESHEASIRKSWKNLLVAQHHDIQICGILKDSRKFLPASVSVSDSISDLAMKYFSSRLTGGNLGQITIFNPVSWSRNELINIKITLLKETRAFTILDGQTEIPFEILSFDKSSGRGKITALISFPATIPELSFKSFSVIPAKTFRETTGLITFDRDSLRIETPFWVLRLDRKGGISSLRNSVTGVSMFQNRRNCYFEGVINGSPMVSAGSWDPDSAKIGVNQASFIEKGRIGPIPYRLEMRINALSSHIDFKVMFDFNNEKIGRVTENLREVASAFLHEEKLRFKAFPLLGIGTTGVRDLPFTIAETDDKYVEGNYWTALADGHKGLAFFNLGNMSTVREDDGGFSLPLAYSMFYVWKTVMLEGKFSYEFAIYPFEGRWENAGLHKAALSYNFPVRSCFTEKGKGEISNIYKPFEIDSGSIILSALYTNEGIPVIRFYESTGFKNILKIKFGNLSKDINTTDLSGKINVPDENPNLFLPWQIKTFKMK